MTRVDTQIEQPVDLHRVVDGPDVNLEAVPMCSTNRALGDDRDAALANWHLRRLSTPWHRNAESERCDLDPGRSSSTTLRQTGRAEAADRRSLKPRSRPGRGSRVDATRRIETVDRASALQSIFDPRLQELLIGCRTTDRLATIHSGLRHLAPRQLADGAGAIHRSAKGPDRGMPPEHHRSWRGHRSQVGVAQIDGMLEGRRRVLRVVARSTSVGKRDRPRPVEIRMDLHQMLRSAACQYSSFSSRLYSLPVGWRGSCSRKSTDRGHLTSARCERQYRISSRGQLGGCLVVGWHVPGLDDGLDLFAEVFVGAPKIATSTTSGCIGEHVLSLLRVDVHTAGDDHEGLAVGEVQEVVLVEIADIAECRPAERMSRTRGLLGVVVVLERPAFEVHRSTSPWGTSLPSSSVMCTTQLIGIPTVPSWASHIALLQ